VVDLDRGKLNGTAILNIAKMPAGVVYFDGFVNLASSNLIPMPRILRVLIIHPDHPVIHKTRNFFGRLFTSNIGLSKARPNKPDEPGDRPVWIAGAKNRMTSWVSNINSN
jgi:hypothetical protein